MTFGMLNCTQHKLVLKEKESLDFATMNHYELKRDVARGTGEYLSAFGETMGCPCRRSRVSTINSRKITHAFIPATKLNHPASYSRSTKPFSPIYELTAKCSLGTA